MSLRLRQCFYLAMKYITSPLVYLILELAVSTVDRNERVRQLTPRCRLRLYRLRRTCLVAAQKIIHGWYVA